MTSDQLRGELAPIVQRALRFVTIPPGARAVFECVLDLSYRLGLTAARFTSHRLLHFETGLAASALSKSLGELESAGIVSRNRRGRGPFVATIQPDYWRWNAPRIHHSLQDADLFKLVVAGGHPLQQLARLASRAQTAQPEMFPIEDTLTSTLAELAREEAAESGLLSAGSRQPTAELSTGESSDHSSPAELSPTESSRCPLSSIHPSSSKSISPSSILPGKDGEWGRETVVAAGENSPRPAVSDDDLLLLARKVFGLRCDRRLEGLITRYAAGNRRAAYIALCRAGDCRREIQKPWAWFAATFADVNRAPTGATAR